MDNNLLCKLIDFLNQEKKSCNKLDQSIIDNNNFKLECKLKNDKYLKDLKDLNISSNNRPNFIILVSGQSNAGGWASSYDANNINDQPNENIFGYDITNSVWKKADLTDTSLGPSYGRAPGTNLFAFHFAKHLIKKFPKIKPGIINICSGGKPIADWALFDKNEEFYEYNKKHAKLHDFQQGHFFNIHKNVYYKALSQILNCSKKIDVVLWHQGETDNLLNSDLKYYNIALLKVIDQYTKLNNNLSTPFIAGTILDYYKSNNNSDNINNIIRNINKNNYSYAEISKLERSDEFHFTSESHRLMGKLYFDAYINMTMNMKNTNIIYFAWINPKKNYKNIINGQMDDLLQSGILDSATLYIQVCCEDKSLIHIIKELFSNKLKSIKYHLEIHTKNIFEYYGIKKMYELAIEEPNKYYLYFHSKGMFNYDNIDERHIYEKTLTKGTIYQHKKVITLFKENPKIMKIGLFPSNIHNKNFIWLNYYWTRGTYLITCEKPIISTNRFYYEIWSGSGDVNMGLTYNLYENNYKKYELIEVGDILNKLNGTFPL